MAPASVQTQKVVPRTDSLCASLWRSVCMHVRDRALFVSASLCLAQSFWDIDFSLRRTGGSEKERGQRRSDEWPPSSRGMLVFSSHFDEVTEKTDGSQIINGLTSRKKKHFSSAGLQLQLPIKYYRYMRQLSHNLSFSRINGTNRRHIWRLTCTQSLLRKRLNCQWVHFHSAVYFLTLHNLVHYIF